MSAAQQQDYYSQIFEKEENENNAHFLNVGRRADIIVQNSVIKDKYGFEDSDDFWEKAQRSSDLNITPLSKKQLMTPTPEIKNSQIFSNSQIEDQIIEEEEEEKEEISFENSNVNQNPNYTLNGLSPIHPTTDIQSKSFNNTKALNPIKTPDKISSKLAISRQSRKEEVNLFADGMTPTLKNARSNADEIQIPNVSPYNPPNSNQSTPLKISTASSPYKPQQVSNPPKFSDISTTPIKTNVNPSPFIKSDIKQSPLKQVHVSNNPIDESPKMNKYDMSSSSISTNSEIDESNRIDLNINRLFNNRKNYYQQKSNRNQRIYSSRLNQNSYNDDISKSKRIPLNLYQDSDDQLEEEESISSVTQSFPNKNKKSYKYRNRHNMNDKIYNRSSSDDDYSDSYQFDDKRTKNTRNRTFSDNDDNNFDLIDTSTPKKFEKYFRNKKSSKENVTIQNRFNKTNFSMKDGKDYFIDSKPKPISISNDESIDKNNSFFNNSQEVTNKNKRYFAKPRQNNILKPNQTIQNSSSTSSDDEIINENTKVESKKYDMYKRIPNSRINEDDSFMESYPVTRISIDDQKEEEEEEKQHIQNDDNDQSNNTKFYPTFNNNSSKNGDSSTLRHKSLKRLHRNENNYNNSSEKYQSKKHKRKPKKSSSSSDDDYENNSDEFAFTPPTEQNQDNKDDQNYQNENNALEQSNQQQQFPSQQPFNQDQFQQEMPVLQQQFHLFQNQPQQQFHNPFQQQFYHQQFQNPPQPQFYQQQFQPQPQPQFYHHQFQNPPQQQFYQHQFQNQPQQQFDQQQFQNQPQPQFDQQQFQNQPQPQFEQQQFQNQPQSQFDQQQFQNQPQQQFEQQQSQNQPQQQFDQQQFQNQPQQQFDQQQFQNQPQQQFDQQQFQNQPQQQFDQQQFQNQPQQQEEPQPQPQFEQQQFQNQPQPQFDQQQFQNQPQQQEEPQPQHQNSDQQDESQSQQADEEQPKMPVDLHPEQQQNNDIFITSDDEIRNNDQNQENKKREIKLERFSETQVSEAPIFKPPTPHSSTFKYTVLNSSPSTEKYPYKSTINHDQESNQYRNSTPKAEETTELLRKPSTKRIPRGPDSIKSGIFNFDIEKTYEKADDNQNSEWDSDDDQSDSAKIDSETIGSQLLSQIKTPKSILKKRSENSGSNAENLTTPVKKLRIEKPGNKTNMPHLPISPAPDVNKLMTPIPAKKQINEEESSDEILFQDTYINSDIIISDEEFRFENGNSDFTTEYPFNPYTTPPRKNLTLDELEQSSIRKVRHRRHHHHNKQQDENQQREEEEERQRRILEEEAERKRQQEEEERIKQLELEEAKRKQEEEERIKQLELEEAKRKQEEEEERIKQLEFEEAKRKKEEEEEMRRKQEERQRQIREKEEMLIQKEEEMFKQQEERIRILNERLQRKEEIMKQEEEKQQQQQQQIPLQQPEELSQQDDSNTRKRRKRKHSEQIQNEEETTHTENETTETAPLSFEEMHNISFPDYPANSQNIESSSPLQSQSNEFQSTVVDISSFNHSNSPSPLPSPPPPLNDDDSDLPPIPGSSAPNSDDEQSQQQEQEEQKITKVPSEKQQEEENKEKKKKIQKSRKTTLKTNNENGSNTKYDPKMDDLPIALRRTMRPRTQPLRHWMNEKIIYKPAENGCFTQYAVQTDLQNSDYIDPLSPSSAETIESIIQESQRIKDEKSKKKNSSSLKNDSEVIPKRIIPGIENPSSSIISFKGIEKRTMKSNEIEILPEKTLELDAKQKKIMVVFSGGNVAQIEYKNGKKWKIRAGGQAYICKGDSATISNLSDEESVHLFVIYN